MGIQRDQMGTQIGPGDPEGLGTPRAGQIGPQGAPGGCAPPDLLHSGGRRMQGGCAPQTPCVLGAAPARPPAILGGCAPQTPCDSEGLRPTDPLRFWGLRPQTPMPFSQGHAMHQTWSTVADQGSDPAILRPLEAATAADLDQAFQSGLGRLRQQPTCIKRSNLAFGGCDSSRL